jgi:hypothetical protein
VQGIAKVVVSLRIIRTEAQCLPVACLCLRWSTENVQGIAKVVVSLGIIRTEAQGLAAARLGLCQAAEGQKSNAEVIVSLGKIRPQTQRRSVARLRVCQAAEIQQGVAKVIVSVWICTVRPERPTNEVDRQVIAPDLMGDDAQQMQSVGMGWLGGQYLTIRRFGLLEPAGLMFGKTALEQISEIKSSCRIQPATLKMASSLIGKLRAHRSRAMSFSSCRSTLLAVHAGNPRIP